MKIITLTLVITIEDDQHGIESQLVPARLGLTGSPRSNTEHANLNLRDVFDRLMREVREGRNPDIWSDISHGPILEI